MSDSGEDKVSSYQPTCVVMARANCVEDGMEEWSLHYALKHHCVRAQCRPWLTCLDTCLDRKKLVGMRLGQLIPG